jgi:hypothetical protein
MSHPTHSRTRYRASSLDKFKGGDLVRLVARFPDMDTVLMGALALESDDPDLEAPVGTVCTVTRRFEAADMTSQPAYAVLIEMQGRSQEMWAYEDELELVQES